MNRKIMQPPHHCSVSMNKSWNISHFALQRWSVRLNPKTCTIFWWHRRLLLWNWADFAIPSSSCSCGLKQKNQALESRLLCELLLHHFNKLVPIRSPIVNISIGSPSNTNLNSLHQFKFIESPQKIKLNPVRIAGGPNCQALGWKFFYQQDKRTHFYCLDRFNFVSLG